MSAPAAAAADRPPPDSPERIWRRRSLWMLAVLLPLVLAAMCYQPVMALLAAKDLVARDADPGSFVQFGGSDWRLDGMFAVKDAGAAGLPEDAVPVLVDFTVRVGDPDLPDLWAGCRVALADGGGRIWEASPMTVVPPANGMTTCGSAAFSGAQAGDLLKIRETFVVPEDALATVHPFVGLGSERPYYLRFPR